VAKLHGDFSLIYYLLDKKITSSELREFENNDPTIKRKDLLFLFFCKKGRIVKNRRKPIFLKK
jgi:hypothetical protein